MGPLGATGDPVAPYGPKAPVGELHNEKKEYKQILSRFSEPVFGDFG